MRCPSRLKPSELSIEMASAVDNDSPPPYDSVIYDKTKEVILAPPSYQSVTGDNKASDYVTPSAPAAPTNAEAPIYITSTSRATPFPERLVPFFLLFFNHL